MQIKFLGTGAGTPSKARNVSSLALKLLDERNEIWLFDCGEATQHQILHTTLRPRKITKIFITHLHGDHIYGLPGFLSSRSFQGNDEPTPLTIYGPVGIRRFIDTTFAISKTHVNYPLHFVEFDDGGTVFSDQQFKVQALKLDHRPQSFGYRIIESDRPGQLNAQKLKELGVPSGPLYGQLKAGKTITLPDGRQINGKDFLSEDIRGRIVTIIGDTRRCDNCLVLAKGADVLVHEATFEQADQHLARRYFHSTSTDAAQVARAAGVKKLYLNHISSRYVGPLAKQLENEAKQIFPESRLVYDLDEVEIPIHQSSPEE